MADISCIRLVPFRQFADGTWGSILVVNWLTETPAAFLFHSEERKKESPNTTRNMLLPSETELYNRYLAEESAMALPAKELYAQYGVARLGGELLSAHIADMVCENLNNHDSRNHRDVHRAENRMYQAKAAGKASVLEAELLQHMDAVSAWERQILEQVLPLLKPGYQHSQWLETTLEKLRAKVYRNDAERGIRAVLESGICKTKADWGAVFKILAERKIVAKTSYLAGAGIINRVCEKEVTTASAIKQSPALVIIGGTVAKGWTDRAHNRQSANLLLHYRDIADIFVNG